MPASSPSEIVLTFDEARRCVEDHARTLRATADEAIPVLSCLGRVLAENIHADRDLPPFRRATRDGFAVRAADVPNVPVKLKLIGQIKAGSALPDNVKI